jgi:hypothetical protein
VVLPEELPLLLEDVLPLEELLVVPEELPLEEVLPDEPELVLEPELELVLELTVIVVVVMAEPPALSHALMVNIWVPALRVSEPFSVLPVAVSFVAVPLS